MQDSMAWNDTIGGQLESSGNIIAWIVGIVAKLASTRGVSGEDKAVLAPVDGRSLRGAG